MFAYGNHRTVKRPQNLNTGAPCGVTANTSDAPLVCNVYAPRASKPCATYACILDACDHAKALGGGACVRRGDGVLLQRVLGKTRARVAMS